MKSGMWWNASTELSATAAESVKSILASGRYSAASLVQSLGEWITVKRSSQPLFCYCEEGRGLDVGAERFACEHVAMRPAELVEACRAQDGTRYHYLTTPVRPGSEWSGVVDSSRAQCAVWIGGRGSTTQAHYDVADNVLFQAEGQKRVRVWPPAAHWALHVFPDSHPRARKAQASIDRVDERFGLRRRLAAPMLDVVLEPGDAIAIPAFWFHHCEALDLSVSLNVFAPSLATRAAARCLASPAPDLDDLCRHLPTILEPHVDDSTSFLREFYGSRFAPLAEAYRARAQNTEPATTPSRPRAPLGSLGRDDRLFRTAALEACREAAGPLAATGVVEIALAHLIELWGMQLEGHDSAAFVASLAPLATL